MLREIELFCADWAVEYDEVKGDTFYSMHEMLGVAQEEMTEFTWELMGVNEQDKDGVFEQYKQLWHHAYNDDEKRFLTQLKKLQKKNFKAIAELMHFNYCVDKEIRTLEAVLSEQNGQD